MSHEPPAPPKLADLMARYLAKQADAHAAGVSAPECEVLPYEAGPVQPVDPKLAWDETLLVLTAFDPALAVRGGQAPPHWSTLVVSHEPVVALACGLGNFPQMVRDFHQILPTADLTALRPVPGRPVAAPLLLDWAAKADTPVARLLALGALRLAKQYDVAERYAADHDAVIPAGYRAAWENERAALAWHAGRADTARARWQTLPDRAPVLFNRGMADLFLGRPADARPALEAAVAALPEKSAWHHLGRLYLTLAEMRG